MQICGIVGCSNRPGVQRDVGFFKVPKVLTDQGAETMKLSEERRRLCQVAVNRKDIETEERWERMIVCYKDFIGGVKAYLHDKTSPSWLPTLDLSYSEITSPAMGAAHERFNQVSQQKHKRLISEAVSSLLTKEKRCIEFRDSNACGISESAEIKITRMTTSNMSNDHKVMEHVSIQPVSR